MNSETAVLDSPALRRRDWQIILLIGVAHSSSHFFQLVLPSLYVSLGTEFGLDFARLGLLVSVFYVVSGLGQASSGFVVDRIGARPVLWFGLACFVLSAVLIGAASGYAMLMLAAAIGGIGNSVFHPADYSIINHRVSPPRLGHAFSLHGLTGNLGWALTPVFITTITLLASWRVAAFSAAALVAVVLLMTVIGRDLLGGAAPAEAGGKSAARPAAQERLADAGGPAGPAGAVGRLPVLRLHLDRAVVGAELHHPAAGPALRSVQGGGQLGAVGLYGGVRAGHGRRRLPGVGHPRTELTVTAALIMAGLTLVVLAMGWVPAG